jgi:hypothetical protein
VKIFWSVGDDSVLRGAAGRGGPEEWAPHGGGPGERERGGAWARHGAVWHRCGSGPAVARAGGALPRDSVERRGRRDVDGVADRWAEMRRGARSLAAGCGVRQRSEAVGAALTSGAGSIVRPIHFFKPNQISFQRNQICPKV